MKNTVHTVEGSCQSCLLGKGDTKTPTYTESNSVREPLPKVPVLQCLGSSYMATLTKTTHFKELESISDDVATKQSPEEGWSVKRDSYTHQTYQASLRAAHHIQLCWILHYVYLDSLNNFIFKWYKRMSQYSVLSNIITMSGNTAKKTPFLLKPTNLSIKVGLGMLCNIKTFTWRHGV